MGKQKEGGDNFMIFERHFEDKADSDINEDVLSIKKSDLSDSSNNPTNSETCSIDAEPFQFLDSPKVPSK
jgi:hypothetical protein